MPTTTAMYTRIRAADGKNTTTAVGTAYRTPDRHNPSTPSSRRGSGVISAPHPPLGAREAGAAASAASIVVREAGGTLAAGVDSGGLGGGWGGGTLGGLGVAEEVGGVVGSADSAAEVSGGRSTAECRGTRAE